jgi:sugar lactone lactonase YvrE
MSGRRSTRSGSTLAALALSITACSSSGGPSRPARATAPTDGGSDGATRGSDGAAPGAEGGPELTLDAGHAAVSLLVGPPEIAGANGLRFDASGKLFVGSVVSGKIFQLDPETGDTLGSFGADHGVLAPDDFVIAPDGTFYVVNLIQGTVVATVPSGDNHVVATPGPGVDGITLSPDGMLIIGKDFLGDGLYAVDPTGATATRTINPAPGWINAMSYGPDGVLYAPVWQKHYVARVDTTTGTITQFSKEFAGTAGAVKFDSKGNMYAVDGGVGDVYRIDTTTGDLTAVFHYGMPLDNLAFDPSDRLFVTSYGDGSVNEIKPDGTLRVVKPGGLLAPAALAVSPDASETVYIGDSQGVPEYDGVKATRLGGIGNGIGVGTRITAPTALRVDGARLLVLGGTSGQIWDRTTGAVLSTLAVSGGVDVVEFNGSTLVSEPAAGAVVTATDTGTTPYASGLGDPAGLAATDSDLYVTIYSAGEIRKLAENGQPLPAPRTVARGLSFPEGLAVLPGGDLLVLETGSGNVVRVNPENGEEGVLAAGVGSTPAPGTTPALGKLDAIGVGASGNVYVLSPVARTVSRLTP